MTKEERTGLLKQAGFTAFTAIGLLLISFDSSTEDLLLSMLPPAICCASVLANMVNKKYEFKQLFKTVTLLSACLLTIIGLPVVICILQDGTTAGVSPVTIKAAGITDITLTMSILCDSI